MARLRTLALRGRLTSSIDSDDTTISSPDLADLPDVAAPDVAVIVLDPRRQGGDPEIIYVTAHTAGATSATVARGQEQETGGSAPRAHNAGVLWINGPTLPDYQNRIVVSPNPGEGQYYASGVDDQDVIMQALQDAADAAGTTTPVVHLAAGTYNLSGPVAFPDAPNMALVGAGRDRTILAGVDGGVILNPVATRFKNTLTDLTIEDAAVGLQVSKTSNSNFERLAFTNCGNAIVLDAALLNRFNDIDVQEATNGIWLSDGGGASSNENVFIGVKCTKVSGGVGVTRPVYVELGNDNHFIGCSFEDFITGVQVDDIGNTFTSCRIEANDQTGTIVYIQLDAGALNNSFVDCYLAGNEWVSRSASIVDNGSGNNFLLFNNVQDQHGILRRVVVTAGELLQLIRSGSGDAKGLIVAEDTYSASGTPIQFLAKGVRAAGKFFSGALSGVDKFWVDGNGDSYFAGKANLDNLSADLSANPSSGGFLYALSGALKYRGAAGDGGAGGNRFLHNRDVEVVAAGSAAALTGSMATLDFGTTDPSVSVPSAGTWIVWVTVQLELNGATYAAGEYTISVKLRNTTDSTDIGDTYVIPILRAVTGITTTTATIGTFTFPVKFSLSAAKTVAIQAQLSATPSAGSVEASKAKITGARLF